MRRRKILRVSNEILAELFTVGPKAFTIRSGLPPGAKLTGINFEAGWPRNETWLRFEHEDWPEVDFGAESPMMEAVAIDRVGAEFLLPMPADQEFPHGSYRFSWFTANPDRVPDPGIPPGNAVMLAQIGADPLEEGPTDE